MIEYRQGDLFSAPPEAILVHACNAQGVWGSGVAKEFKTRFPTAFKEYTLHCLDENIVGTCKILNSDKQRIACLFTSKGYGKYVDEPSKILSATSTAFTELLFTTNDSDEIHMPMINSGLFKVPWEETAKILYSTLMVLGRTCVVWEKK